MKKIVIALVALFSLMPNVFATHTVQRSLEEIEPIDVTVGNVISTANYNVALAWGSMVFDYVVQDVANGTYAWVAQEDEDGSTESFIFVDNFSNVAINVAISWQSAIDGVNGLFVLDPVQIQYWDALSETEFNEIPSDAGVYEYIGDNPTARLEFSENPDYEAWKNLRYQTKGELTWSANKYYVPDTSMNEFTHLNPENFNIAPNFSDSPKEYFGMLELFGGDSTSILAAIEASGETPLVIGSMTITISDVEAS